MNAYEVVVEKGAFSKTLSPQQRAFAEETIQKIAASGDPFNYRDCNGVVEALQNRQNSKLGGQYKYKPFLHVRKGSDLEIRIQFKPSAFRKFVIVIVRVFLREELYVRK